MILVLTPSGSLKTIPVLSQLDLGMLFAEPQHSSFSFCYEKSEKRKQRRNAFFWWILVIFDIYDDGGGNDDSSQWLLLQWSDRRQVWVILLLSARTALCLLSSAIIFIIIVCLRYCLYIHQISSEVGQWWSSFVVLIAETNVRCVLLFTILPGSSPPRLSLKFSFENISFRFGFFSMFPFIIFLPVLSLFYI